MIPWGAKNYLLGWRYVYCMYKEKSCKLGRYYSHDTLGFLNNPTTVTDISHMPMHRQCHDPQIQKHGMRDITLTHGSIVIKNQAYLGEQTVSPCQQATNRIPHARSVLGHRSVTNRGG